MTRRPAPRKLMIMDACVLIDFIKAERAVLELVVKHIGPLHVTSPVVDEVNEIDDENELVALGLIIIEPEIEDAYTAGGRSGPLSFEDWLCLLTAKRHGFTCVTNDKNLRKLCKQEGVSLLWGSSLWPNCTRSAESPARRRKLSLKPYGGRIPSTSPKRSSRVFWISFGGRKVTGPGHDEPII